MRRCSRSSSIVCEGSRLRTSEPAARRGGFTPARGAGAAAGPAQHDGVRLAGERLTVVLVDSPRAIRGAFWCIMGSATAGAHTVSSSLVSQPGGITFGAGHPAIHAIIPRPFRDDLLRYASTFYAANCSHPAFRYWGKEV